MEESLERVLASREGQRTHIPLASVNQKPKRSGKARQRAQGNIRTRRMPATPYQACVLWLVVLEHFGTPYNAQAMQPLSLGTSTLIVSPVYARSTTSAERLRRISGTRLDFACGQPWLPCEEDRCVRSVCRGLSNH